MQHEHGPEKRVVGAASMVFFFGGVMMGSDWLDPSPSADWSKTKQRVPAGV
jgi:hypothetical protein